MPAGALLLGNVTGPIPVPQSAPVDLAVASDFERFDGLTPLDHPAGQPGVAGSANRPGQSQTTPDVYTPGPIAGVVGTLGGQPLPVSDRIHRGPGQTQEVNTPQMQWRLGVGQVGPSSLGVAQTVALSEITSSPPVPGDLTSILAGLS